MKKSLLLAALLLSSAVKAETWVCSEVSSVGETYMTIYVRQGEKFSGTLNAPMYKNIDLGLLEILAETDVLLTLGGIEPDATEVGITIIEKETGRYVNGAISFAGPVGRSTGSCVKIEG